jgi:hypothetical protein
VHTNIVIVVGAWFLAAAATYIPTSTSVFFWLRVRLHKRARAAANVTAADIRTLPRDYPEKLRNRMRTKYWLQEATVMLPFCIICVGWWVYLAATMITWWSLGAPGRIAGVPAWFVLIAAWHAGWLLFIAANKLIATENAIPDTQGVEDEPGSS